MLLAAKSEAASIPDAATQSAPTYDASVDAPASAQAAEIAHPRRIRGPCTDCRLSVPGLREPRPLLVLLHGDNETAESIFGA